jgi:hypothetical protein
MFGLRSYRKGAAGGERGVAEGLCRNGRGSHRLGLGKGKKTAGKGTDREGSDVCGQQNGMNENMRD